LRDGREVPLPYSVRRLWEEDPGPILGCGNPWLLPFVPLMRVSDPCRAVVECARRIRAARLDPDDRRDILVCLAGLAGIVVEDYGLIANAVWEEPMRESSWIRHWVDKGVEEGREQGLQQGIAQGIEKGRAEAAGVVLDVLSERFGAVPADVEEKVRAECSFDRLHEFARLALRARSIEEFAARI